MRTVIYSVMLPFFSLVTLLLLIRYDLLFEKKQGRLFRFAVIISMALMAVASLDSLLAKEWADIPNAWVFRRITSCINFSGPPVIPILLYKIFMHTKNKPGFYLPFVLNSLLCVASIFWGLVFKITPLNSYDRGPLFFVPFCVGVVYIFMLIYRVESSNRRRGERAFLFSVIGMLALSMFLEIAFQYKFLTWVTAGLSLPLYYLLININFSNCDPLTGAYNRAMYNKELSRVFMAYSCTIALLDLNNFKQVNDQQGHDAGDRYLIRFVELLECEMEKGSNLYRIGGDEFAILSTIWDEAAMRKRLDSARSSMDLLEMSFAYGISTYKPGDDLEEKQYLADQNMYADKKRNKSGCQ